MLVPSTELKASNPDCLEEHSAELHVCGVSANGFAIPSNCDAALDSLWLQTRIQC